MPPEIIALIDKPHLIVGPLGGAFVGVIVGWILSEMRRQAWRARNRWRWERKRNRRDSAGEPWVAKPFDAADQLRIVMASDFSYVVTPSGRVNITAHYPAVPLACE